MMKKISNRNVIEEVTEEIDEAEFVGQHNFLYLSIRMICLRLTLVICFCTDCVVKSDRLPLDDDRLREDYYYEDKLAWAMSQWQFPSNRVSDKKTSTGTDRASYQARQPNEGDKERLTMRQGTCLHQYPNEFTIWDFERTEQYITSNVTRKRCTEPPTKTSTQEHDWLLPKRLPTVREKDSSNVDFFYKVSTYQCSILFNNIDSFNRNSDFRKVENMHKLLSSNEKFNVTNDPQLSLFTEFWWTTTRMWSWRQRLTAYQQMKRSYLMTIA